MTGIAQRRQRLDNARVCARGMGRRLQIESAIALDELRHRRRVDGYIPGDDRAAHEFRRPVADQPAHRGNLQRRAAEFGEQPIEGAGQIGGAVDQRAVEIENQVAGWSCHGPAGVRSRGGDPISAGRNGKGLSRSASFAIILPREFGHLDMGSALWQFAAGPQQG